MIEDSLHGELKNTFILAVDYHEDHRNYKAKLMVPFFRNETEPYIIGVNDADFFPDEEVKVDNQHLDKLRYFGKLILINRLIHASRSPDTNVAYVLEQRIAPFYNRIVNERKEIIAQYLDTFCQHILKRQISKTLPLNVYFDESNSTINFKIPFLNVIPAIHINTVLHNWTNKEDFIEDVTQSLIANCIPAKNEQFFKGNSLNSSGYMKFNRN